MAAMFLSWLQKIIGYDCDCTTFYPFITPSDTITTHETSAKNSRRITAFGPSIPSIMHIAMVSNKADYTRDIGVLPPRIRDYCLQLARTFVGNKKYP